MKTTNKLALLLIVLPAISSAQNYQTVQSNAIPFFITTTGDYFLANRIDQIDVISSDSIFYPFQSIRENDQLSQTDPCKYYSGASWMGEKIIIKPNGDNVFYNHLNEPFTIKTLAALNDTFTVYTYPNGDWIKGIVSSISAVSVFGYPDSIKTIDLFSNSSLNLSNPRFVLSKDHGFIELFAPYSFPDPYSGSAAVNGISDYPSEHTNNFSLVGEGQNGFSKPTVGDINDFEIGDVHQFSYSEEIFSVSKKEQFIDREIFNKFIWGQDSVVYFLKNNGFTKSIDYVEGTTEIEYYDGAMESWTIEHVTQWQNPFLPEEFDGINEWTSLFINDCGDVEEIVRTENIELSGTGNCLQLTNNPFSKQSYVKNVGELGIVKFHEESDFQSLSSLVYYSRPNGDNCGSEEVLSIKESETELNLVVFPNPSSGLFSISGLSNFENALVNIYDNQGRIVYTDNLYQEGETINLGNLNSGLYRLVVRNEEVIHQTQIVLRY